MTIRVKSPRIKSRIDGYRQLAPTINGSVTTFVNTRALVCSLDRRNSTPLFLTGMRPKPAATPPIYPQSCPDLPLLSPVECQSWDQPPWLLPRGSASDAVTQTVLKKTRGVAFCAGCGGTRLLRQVLPALRSPRRRRDADDRGYLSRWQTCRCWRYVSMSQQQMCQCRRSATIQSPAIPKPCLAMTWRSF